MAISRVLKYDFDSLPSIPFAIYFIYEGEVNPLKWFTVTEKRINEKKEVVEIYLQELDKFVAYDDRIIRIVPNVHIN